MAVFSLSKAFCVSPPESFFHDQQVCQRRRDGGEHWNVLTHPVGQPQEALELLLGPWRHRVADLNEVSLLWSVAVPPNDVTQVRQLTYPKMAFLGGAA
jgi:hypothetical protein